MQDDNTLKHTPGLWRAVEFKLNGYTAGNYWHIKAGDGFFDGSIQDDGPRAERSCGFPTGAYMAEADANVLAAAPDLLIALRELVRVSTSSEVNRKDYSAAVLAADRAVAVAEGRP